MFLLNFFVLCRCTSSLRLSVNAPAPILSVFCCYREYFRAFEFLFEFDVFPLFTDRTSIDSYSAPRTQSPILADAEEVSTLVVLAKVEEGEESGERDGFSLTEPHTFSDGVWLDADRSEGEAGGVAMFGAEEVTNLAREVGPLPSSSESVRIH